jgi:putative hydrolase of the HAD superfamily
VTRARGLLLDFGGVVTRSFFETRSAFEELLGLPANTRCWRGPFAPDADRLWLQVQAGELSESAYWSQCALETGAAVGERWTMQEFCRKHNDLPIDVVVRPEALRAIADAKRAGIRLAIVTNELEAISGRLWVEGNPVIGLFDALIDASRTGIRKPDPRAYRLALHELGLDAADAVFVDDQIRNVDGARQAGIRALHLDITRPAVAFELARAELSMAR